MRLIPERISRAPNSDQHNIDVPAAKNGAIGLAIPSSAITAVSTIATKTRSRRHTDRRREFLPEQRHRFELLWSLLEGSEGGDSAFGL